MGSSGAAPSDPVLASVPPSPSKPALVGPLGRDTTIALISAVTNLLFANGQTTEEVEGATAGLSGKLGVQLSLFPNWDKSILRFDDAAGQDKIIARAFCFRLASGLIGLVQL